jgi:LemA protein
MPSMWIFLGVLLVAGFYVVSVYNSLQTLLTQIEASIQEIGNQLKRQASLIPNLQTSVKAFMKQEKEVFQMLSDARTSVDAAVKSGSAKSISEAETALQAVIPRLQVAVEDNPELKSNETVQQFMNELRDTADKLTYARRALIDLTQNYNEKLVTFPSNLIANIFGFKKQAGLATALSGSHLEVSESESRDPKVDL